jgi:hypothetical protein
MFEDEQTFFLKIRESGRVSIDSKRTTPAAVDAVHKGSQDGHIPHNLEDRGIKLCYESR